MQRLFALSLVLTLVCLAPGARAAEGKVIKVFPQYVDKEGRHTLAPSLFARDAYQALMRKDPSARGGMRVAVQWKAKTTDWPGLRLKIEMRGVKGNAMHTVTLEKPAVKNGWLSNWAEVRLTGRDYADFGEMVAWRASLWDGPRELSAQQSYLWSGVPASIK